MGQIHQFNVRHLIFEKRMIDYGGKNHPFNIRRSLYYDLFTCQSKVYKFSIIERKSYHRHHSPLIFICHLLLTTYHLSSTTHHHSSMITTHYWSPLTIIILTIPFADPLRHSLISPTINPSNPSICQSVNPSIHPYTSTKSHPDNSPPITPPHWSGKKNFIPISIST